MPALMQQVAINMTINDECDVFSVNGPPGTGKTTLIKEIVANNVVERAKLLAKYNNPDEAFDAHEFTGGDKVKNAYSKYIRHWYTLKNDSINDYGILVTSCNNAAVENISKELPQKIDIDITSEKISDGLREIGKLFDEDSSEQIELLKNGFGKEKYEYHDVYFTKYASDLLTPPKKKGEKVEPIKTWGLIAAALGKKSNIKHFYDKVLKPLYWDFYGSNACVDNRLEKYTKAKKDFLSQKKIVCDMQSEIAEIANGIADSTQENELLNQLILKCNKIEEDIKNDKQNISAKDFSIELNLKTLTSKKSRLNDEVNSLNAAIQQNHHKYSECESNIVEYKKKAYDVMKNIGSKPLIFGKAEYKEKYTCAKNYADELKKKANEQEVEKQKYAQLTCDYDARLKDANDNIKIIDANIEKCKKEINELHNSLAQDALRLEKLNNEINRQKQKVADKKDSLSQIPVVIDNDFIEKILSKDIDASTKAQVQNPWFTEKYNREREKLFAYAMRLNKEFVLSSKSCRFNLKTLGQYWGMLKNESDQRVCLSDADKNNCVGALLQTLFLLVPVISTTFASVGSFLKDVKKPRTFGTLVVDEAGQAQPHMQLAQFTDAEML